MKIKKLCISPDCSVHQAVKAIDAGGKKMIFIADEEGILKGIFTDGDMRRYMLAQGDFSVPVANVMNSTPFTCPIEQRGMAMELMTHEKYIGIPLLDKAGRLADAIFWNDVSGETPIHRFTQPHPVIMMAGGKGTRLYPYTKILPKPLIPIGEIPIAEHIINRFHAYGSEDFYMILNHKKGMIKAYFNDIQHTYRVHYVDETEFLGTGGGLSLLKGKIHETTILTNCDILLDCDYSCIYDFHKASGNVITIVSAMKNVTVPYGVIEMTADGQIASMQEKPEFSYLVNTGIYFIEPCVIEELEENRFIGMPDVAEEYQKRGCKVGTYPISEKSWMDMGQIEEMEAMCRQLGVSRA